MRSKTATIAIIAAMLGASLGYSRIAAADPLLTPHDNFNDAKIIGSIPYEDRIPIAYQASSEPGEPLCRATSNRTVWYRFTPAEDRVVDLERGGSTSIIAIAVYLGDGVGSLSTLACGWFDAPVSFFAKAGVTHHIQVGVNHTSEVVLQAFEGTSIRGRITDQTGAPVSGACVSAHPHNGSFYSDQTGTTADNDGRYHLVGLRTGNYALRFGCFQGVWRYEYHDNKAFLSEADHVTYTRGANLEIDAELDRRSSISGILTDSQGNPIETCAYARTPQGAYAAVDYTSDQDGFYQLVVSPGNYVLQFGCAFNHPWALEFYDDALSIGSAQVINLPEVADLTGFDATLTRRGRVSGRVLGPSGESVGYSQCAKLYRPDNPNNYASITFIDDDGSYELFAEQGSYKLFFGACWSVTPFIPEWYEDRVDFESADTITLDNGDEIPIEVLLEKIPPPPNDNRADAEEIESVPFTKTPTLISATSEEGEPTACSGFAGTAWYRYSPIEDTDLSLTVGDRNGRVGVFLETFDGKLRLVACGGYFSQSDTAFVAEAGRTYFIQVSGGVELVTNLRGERLIGVTSTEIYAPSPCVFACPYWQGTPGSEQGLEDSCAPQPNTVPGSFHDTAVTVPTEIEGRVPTHLLFHVNPEIDYDLWICRSVADEGGNYYVTHGANTVTEGCPDLPLFCRENAFTEIVPGETYILRAYNWSDGPSPTGFYGYASLL